MELYPCSSKRDIQSDHSIMPSSVIFAAGLLGNIIAVIILWQHKLNVKTQKTSVFYIMVTGLTIVNLMGKIVVCPVVLAAYSKNETLFQLTENQYLCQCFAFGMIFLGLAPTFILLAMAVDCWMALAYPFTYRRHITKKVGLVIPLVSCVFSLGFCSLPFFGIGRFVQYCPGTWCFIEMTVKDSAPGDRIYSMLYGTMMGLVVVAIIFFNAAIMRHLYTMYRNNSMRNIAGSNVGNKTMDGSQAQIRELSHLMLLAVMTVIFAVCSLPLTMNGRTPTYIFTASASLVIWLDCFLPVNLISFLKWPMMDVRLFQNDQHNLSLYNSYWKYKTLVPPYSVCVMAGHIVQDSLERRRPEKRYLQKVAMRNLLMNCIYSVSMKIHSGLSFLASFSNRTSDMTALVTLEKENHRPQITMQNESS